MPDDLPVRGRVLDTQGRPLAGVTVKVAEVYDPPAGDLDALLASGTIETGRHLQGPYGIGWWVKGETDWVRKTLQTDADGRFRIDGAGRDRLVFLEFAGPGIATSSVCAMTRIAPVPVRTAPRADDDAGQSLATPRRSTARPSTMSSAPASRSRAWCGSRGPAVRWPESG